MSSPKRLRRKYDRECARRMRDMHWEWMERMAHQTLYVRLWNKHRLPDADDVLNLCLMSGMDFMTWVRSHKDWFDIQPWDEERKADPFILTDAGREALKNRHLYDMEDHHGGLVEPGYIVTPSKPEARP